MTVSDLCIELNSDVLFGDIDGQVVAMQVTSGKYLFFNETACVIIKILRSGPRFRISDICANLEQEYDVNGSVCLESLTVFIDRCQNLGIVTVNKM